MKKLSVRLGLLTALSVLAVSALPGEAQQIGNKIQSSRDPQSSWIITSPSHRFDPKTGRRLVAFAHRVVDSTIEPSHQAASIPEIDLPAGKDLTGDVRGAALPSYPTFYSLYVNNQLVGQSGPGVYSFQGIRLGTDPQQTDKTTNIPTYIVPVKITGPDGTVYDPSARIPGLNASTIELQLDSPVFKKTDLQFAGQNFGTTQLLDAWVRAQNWNYVSAASHYHLYLDAPKTLPALNLTPNSSLFSVYNLGPGSGVYRSSVAVIDINYLDYMIRGYIAAAQAKGLISPAAIPIFLTSYNVQASNAGGYHDDVDNQVYTWVGYFPSSLKTPSGYDDSVPSPIRDGTVMEHEFAELIDHPYVRSGDQSACSLWGYEVGDPLESGQNDFILANPKGYLYGFQDLTFYSYNIGDVPSVGINGQYTLQGTYTYPCAEI